MGRRAAGGGDWRNDLFREGPWNGDEPWNEPRRLRLRWTWTKRCLVDISAGRTSACQARPHRGKHASSAAIPGKLSPARSRVPAEILIPCFKLDGRYLPLALASNTMPAIPVTVIDDAFDWTIRPLKFESLRARFKIKVIRNEKNLLQSGSLNKAIAGSPNNLFIILNADDLLVPYVLDVLFKVLRRDAEVGSWRRGSAL